VAANLRALGVQTSLVGVCGRDDAAAALGRLLADLGVGDDGLVAVAGRPTTMKTRIIAQHQQVVRADHEDDSPLPAADAARVLARLRELGPFDGVVTTKYAEVGEVVAPFGAAANARAAVVTMADLNSLMVEVDVAESNLDKVHLGQPGEISLDAIPGRRFAGEVHMIVPTADRTKATVLTKVKFLETDSRILPEMSAKVAFLSQPLDPKARQPRLIIPKGALVTREGRTYSFLVAGSRVKLVPVTPGATMNDLVEIAAGLKEGDRVVLNPPAALKDGSRVKVKES